MVVTATTQPTIVEVRMARVVICLSRRTSCRLDPIPILLGRSGTCVVVVVSGSEGLGRDEAGVEEISPPPTLRRFFDAGDGAVLAVLHAFEAQLRRARDAGGEQAERVGVASLLAFPRLRQFLG